MGRVDDADDGAARDLEMSLVWRLAASGSLVGQLRARNVSDRRVRLPWKPGLKPLGRDGLGLEVACIVTLEMRHPDYLDILPGEEAVARVDWAGWDGPPAVGDWDVTVPWGAWRVRAEGPRQPDSTGPATNVSSNWWEISPAAVT